MSKRLSYVGHDSNYLPVEPNTDSQDELRNALLDTTIINEGLGVKTTMRNLGLEWVVDRLLPTITARDAEREAAIRMDEGKYWENNIMPEFRSWQTSEKMSNRYKALEAIKRKARP